MADINVQFGAGWSVAPGWQSFDNSPSLRLERLPLVGRLLHINEGRFPEGVVYGDILKGLPVPLASAKAVYASHVLEHLSFSDCRLALENTLKILKPGGRFRLIVPDLRGRVEIYVKRVGNDTDAANDFCRSTMFGVEERPRGMMSTLRSLIGNHRHLWMWDEASMSDALRRAGFTDIRRCEMGDSQDPDFRLVEDAARFVNNERGIRELALEARRPS